jgi:hypothetical protein
MKTTPNSNAHKNQSASNSPSSESPFWLVESQNIEEDDLALTDNLELAILQAQQDHLDLQEKAKRKAQLLNELYNRKAHLDDSPLRIWRRKSWTEDIESKSKTLQRKLSERFPVHQPFWDYKGQTVHGPSVYRLITLGRLEIQEKKNSLVFRGKRVSHPFGREVIVQTFEITNQELTVITELLREIL